MTAHPTYGEGRPALVYIGDSVGYGVDHPIGTVCALTADRAEVELRAPAGLERRFAWFRPAGLTLIARGEP